MAVRRRCRSARPSCTARCRSGEADGLASIALRHGTLRGILWHQGESDSAPDRQVGYDGKLKALFARFGADLDAPDVPIVVGELGRFRERKEPGTTTLNAMLRAFVTANGNVAHRARA